MIKDSGSTIESSVADSMFEAGFSTKGTDRPGMGLHAARRLLSSAGGSIAYDPEIGFKILVLKAD